MCTAVAYALAFGFIVRPHQPVAAAFSVERVDRCMRACHAFFVAKNIQKPLMLKEMQRWFPMRDYDDGISEGEVAGLTSSPTSSDGLTDDGLLLLEPLSSLIMRIVERTQRGRIALVVTYHEHTRVLVSDRPGSLCTFDPMVGGVTDLDLPVGAEYAGVLLANK
jgi:hypothetical protein